MIANIPSMTHAQRQERADAKAFAVCEFLAGEIYSTADVIALLLNLDRSRAVACLKSLEKQGFVKSEDHYIEARTQKLYGISPGGLALADACGGPHFELGRLGSGGKIPHRLATQRLHIKAVSAGWSAWTPDRQLDGKSLKKIPDAVATDKEGRRVAIECETSIKTDKRYAEILILYLKAIKSGVYSEVHYVSPVRVAHLVERAFRSIKSVKVGGEVVQITEAHFSKFKFFSFDTWPAQSESEAKNG